MSDDELPPNVTPISGRRRESHGTRSRHRFADEDGRCIHALPDDHFCHAGARQHPGRCHLRAGWGTDHLGAGQCKLHGGAIRDNARHAQEQLLRRRAERALAQLNTAPTPVDNPLAALASLAGEADRWKNVLAAHVADLSSLRYAVRASVQCPDCEITFTPEHPVGSTEQIRGEVLLYERSLANLGRLLVAIGRLNIDDRLARIDERMTDMVVRAVDAGLLEAGVKPADMDRVRFIVGDVLRRYSA